MGSNGRAVLFLEPWPYMGVGGQCCAPAAFSPGRRRGSHCTAGWLDPKDWSEWVWKILTSLAFDPQIVQPVGSHYTD